MSEQTRQALQEAIEAHVADECDGDLAGGWVCVAETTTAHEALNNHTSWYVVEKQFQSAIVTTGLLTLAQSGATSGSSPVAHDDDA